MIGAELGYRAWRLDQLDLDRGPAFPAGHWGPADLGACLHGPFTFYNVLAVPGGWRVAVVAYHGRTATWCCGCSLGIAGPRPCDHARGVAYWVELDRHRRAFLDLPEWELREAWGRAVRWHRAIRGVHGGCATVDRQDAREANGNDELRIANDESVAPGPEPAGWRLRAAALFDALCERGLASRPFAEADPVYELAEQLVAVAA